MNFKNWTEAKDKAEDLNLYTKAYLKEGYNRKPLKEAKSEWHRVYTGGKWRDFEFYKMEDTIEIKNRVKKEVIQLEITNENIFKALYVVNKSAKKSRDSKVKNYSLRNYGIVSRCKDRQNDLYNLKDLVMQKAIAEKIIEFQGYHLQVINGITNYLCLYKGGNFTFHIPMSEKPTGNFLGEINSVIASEIKVNTKITFTQAIDILGRYIAK